VAGLQQGEAEAAKLLRHVQPEVACLLQILEVLVEKVVLADVPGGALAAVVDQALRERVGGGLGDGHSSPSLMADARPTTRRLGQA
jgi:hypothetical protein